MVDVSSPEPQELYLNRELSWLSFNGRVMEEATSKRHPLLERVRFLSIAADNLDEFFMVRLAALKNQHDRNSVRRSLDGRTASEQIEDVLKVSHQMMGRQQAIWRNLRKSLAKEKISLIRQDEVSEAEKDWLMGVFDRDYFPILTPLAIDPAHPFPFIPNKELVIFLHLENPKTGEKLDALLPIPNQLGRMVELPLELSPNGHQRFITVERMVLLCLQHLFPPFDLIDFSTFRVIRDSELDIADEADDLIQTFERALRRRRRGHVIQLKVYKKISKENLEILKRELRVKDEDIYKVDGLIGLADIKGMIPKSRNDLQFTPFETRYPERVREMEGDCFAAIRKKDMVIHHPYESFDVVVRFLQQAARDPDVIAIRQTLYRTSRDSPIMKALIEAAEAGKSVTAMVELKARFDEEANMRWAQDLERAGAKVVFGFVNLKTHAKMSLVVRKEDGQNKMYGHFGTGNYHPDTAKIYTDLSYFTCDPAFCSDMVKIFNTMTGYAEPQDMKHVVVAPYQLRNRLVVDIDNEIAAAKAGKPSGIWMKMNSLVDGPMIDKLYEASQAGVPIDLVIRGICSLRPGVKGLSDRIRVKSIVGRYLEHARIYAFANGKPLPHKDAKLYISSADLMTRNLDHRIETLVSIINPTVHQQILSQIMTANLKDRVNSWIMKSDGTYEKMRTTKRSFSAHDYFMNNPSLSGRGSAILDEAPLSITLDRRRK